MIDRSKNHVYIITVDYYILNGEGRLKRQSKTFTSLHSINTQPWKEFLANKITNMKGFQSIDETTQYTVPLSDFCR